MNDLISRQAAIDAIFSEPLYESGMKKRDADAVVPAIYEKIKSLPSVQPEQKKAKWVKDKTNQLYCSACGQYGVYSEKFGTLHTFYCPYCGAKMGEE